MHTEPDTPDPTVADVIHAAWRAGIDPLQFFPRLTQRSLDHRTRIDSQRLPERNEIPHRHRSLT